MENKIVDDFINTKVLPELRPDVERIRELMKEYAPEAKEIISYGIPAYRVHKIIAVISPTKKDITLAFSRGAEFENKYHLLQGVGKVSKHLKFTNAAEFDKDVMNYCIMQALRLDAK